MFNLIKSALNFGEYEKSTFEGNSYKLPPSISQKFSWADFDADSGFFELDDGRSVAAVYEIFPISTEGQPEPYLNEIANDFALLFGADGFRQYYKHESPWIIQFYVSDDEDLDDEMGRYAGSVDSKVANSAFTKCYLSIVKNHLKYLTKPGGVFKDPLSDKAFKGKVRRVRMVLYRRMHSKSFLSKRHTPVSDLQGVCKKMEEQLKGSGIRYSRLDEYQFYKWMFKWLSPNPRGFLSSKDYLSKVKFPLNEAEKPPGFDLTQSVFSSVPVSDTKTGTWSFDGVPHRFIPIVGFTRVPKSGHLSAERSMVSSESNAKIFAPLDKLPEGSTFTMTFVIQSQEHQKKMNARIYKKSRKTKEYDAKLAGQEALVADALIASGNCIYPTSMGVFIQAKTEEELFSKESDVIAVLSQKMSFKVLSDDKDARQIDRYIRYLPMNYCYTYDSKYLLQSRLATLKQVAATVPIYGRTRGSGNPLFAFTNRLGEPVYFDPFKDRVSNAHMLILGTTGSGKSNLSAYLISQLLASVRPRMVIVDAGESFKYVINFAEAMGVKTNSIKISMEKPNYTLNPFTETKSMLKQVRELEELNQSLSDYDNEYEEKIQKTVEAATKQELLEEVSEKENRDYLMEFVTASILMITGAEQKEIEELDRQDRYLILEAIKKAAKTAIDNGFNQMIPSDLARALELLSIEANEDPNSHGVASKLAKMSHGLMSFINMPLNAMYFNQRGAALPETDVTYFEMGLFKDDRPENEAPRALAFIKLMNDSMTKAEKYKNEGRHFIFYADECHTVTSKAITAASIVQATKMGRKLNFWIWLATQNLQDFPQNAVKAVSMLEYKLILWCDRKEREHIKQFIDLTNNQSSMLASLTKAKGKYVEAMLLSNSGSYLFRNVPPREILTLAATDGEENALRQELMREFDCDGVIASFLMAQKFRGEEYNIELARELCHV